MSSRTLLSAVLTALVVLAVPTAAEAKLGAAVTVETKAGKTRIVAKLTSTKTLPARQRPRTVSAVAGGRTYTLTRSGTVTGKKLGTWRSAAVTGAAATRLQALAGTQVRLRIRLRSGRSTSLSAKVPAAAPGGGAPGTGTTTPAPAAGVPGTAPGGARITLTRNDGAGQGLVGGGDLLLERYQFGASGQTAQYNRIWFYGSGEMRINTIAWNSVSGESCTDVKLGSWVFKEAYTFPEAGGGVIVKIGVTLGGQAADEILTFGTNEPNNVYVGQQLIQFERNPQMQQNC